MPYCRSNLRQHPAQPTPAGARTGRLPRSGLELQTTLAGSFSQRLDATMEAVTGTVECDLLDPGSLGSSGDCLTDLGGGVSIAAVLQAFHHGGLGGRCRGKTLRTV